MDVGGTNVGVPVGEGITTEVAVMLTDDVSVGDGIGSVVDVDPLEVDVAVADDIGKEVSVSPFDAEVSVSDGNGGAVTVSASDVDVSVGDTIGGATVVAAVLVAVEEMAVLMGVEVPACGAFTGNQNIKQINISRRISATINLNRS